MNILDKLVKKITKETTQVILFIKRRGEWKLQRIKTSLNDIADIENLVKRKRVEDFKIWLVEDIDTTRYWNDLNFYNPANFIYLPLKHPDKKWAWFNLNENVPYPKYNGEITSNFKMVVEQMDEEHLLLSFPDFSENKYPILKKLFGINQVELIKEFLLKLKQNKQASCTVSGVSPFTFLAWEKDNKIRFQVWHYESEPLFKYKNGMVLLVDLEVKQEEFYSEFEKMP